MSGHKINLTSKRIILGVTGSIAAYKAASIASTLTKMGAEIDVILTESAERFITPLTFQALTGRPVYTSMWQTEHGGGIGTHIAHVGLAHEADLLLIAPATGHTMAKLAHGIADDLLSLTALAAGCPLVIAPAMDAGMYDAPATQANAAILEERGVHFAGPTLGRMASGLEGLGRFLEPDEVIDHARYVLGQTCGPLRDRHIVVTAGPTREPLDPVRFLSNRSSGKQGFAIAEVARDAGARVTLIAGPVSLPTPVGVKRIDVVTAVEMRDAVLSHACGSSPADALIMSAAVADFRPAALSDQKIKKESGTPSLKMAANPDILLEVSQQEQRPRMVVGFAAETSDVLDNAAGKLARKKLDLIVANDITATDAGFGVDTNRVHFVTVDGAEAANLMSKYDVGQQIITRIAAHLDGS